MSRRRALSLLLALAAAPFAACGKKGDLEPPPETEAEKKQKKKPAGS